MMKRRLSREQVELTHHNHGGPCRMCSLVAVAKAKAKSDGKLDIAVRQLAFKFGIETTDPGLYVPEVKGMLRLHQRAADKTTYHHMVRIPEMNYLAEKQRLAREYSMMGRRKQAAGTPFMAPMAAFESLAFRDTPDGKAACAAYEAVEAKERAKKVCVAELLGCKGIFFEDAEQDDSMHMLAKKVQALTTSSRDGYSVGLGMR
jgi:hypothetical protein